MIIHTKATYESFDGELFDDDIDCLNHELNESYERSGIRFTNCDETERMCNLTDDSYNKIDYIVINRTKKKENELFLQIAVKDFGWSLLGDLLNGNERKYQLTFDKLIPIKSSA